MLEELKRKVLEVNLLLPKYGLITFTQGSVSGINREHGVVAIKPNGVEYDDMSAGDIVLCDLEGNVVKGKLKPGNDLVTHLEFYKDFLNIGGAMHTHSRWATALAQVGKAIPTLGTTQADYFYGDIPYTRQISEAEIHREYELETGHVIVEAFKQKGIDPNSMPEVLVHSHGPFSQGKDPFEVVHNTVVMRERAAIAFVSVMLQNGSAQPVQKVLLDKHFKRKHGPNACHGQGSSS